MSVTVVTYPMVGAVKAGDKILGENREWKASKNPVSGPMQERFLKEFYEVCQQEVSGIPELESIASWEARDINKFLSDRGFDISLEQFPPQNFGTASVLDLLVEWLKKGEITTIKTDDGREFPGVRIGKDGVQFSRSDGHNHPIAYLYTKSGDVVYMTMMADSSGSSFDLVSRAEELYCHRRPIREFGGLVFPMVSLDQMVNIAFLVGLNTIDKDGVPADIVKALQQTKLRMNEVGARVQSAVAVQVRGLSAEPPRPDHIINRPFLVWFERRGLKRPLFVGRITEEDWKNPGSLD